MNERATTHTATNGRTRMRALFVAGCAVAALLFGLVLCFAPASLHVYCTEGGVNVQVCKNEAMANPVYTTLGKALLEEYAAAAGLSASDFVATVSCAIVSATGMEIAADTGIKYGNSLSLNLEALLDAADYPAWEDLTSTQQANYQDKENYECVKFNSLMSAFGYDTVTNGYYGSYGGTFEPGEELSRKLETIGNIGQRWALGLPNAFEVINALFTDKSAVSMYLGRTDVRSYDASNRESWPTNVPRNLIYSYGNVCEARSGNSLRAVSSNPDTYWFTYHASTNSYFYVVAVSKTSFTVTGNFYDPTTTQPNYNTQAMYAENYGGLSGYTGYYRTWMSTGMRYPYWNWVPEVNELIGNVPTANGDWQGQCVEASISILADGAQLTGVGTPDLDNYPDSPDEIEPEKPIYYPAEGVGVTNNWNNYITPRDPVRPDNPYNPNDQTQGDDWKNDTEANVIPLASIRFDKLFPFSLLYDISKMFDKVDSMTQSQSGSGQYDKITIPFMWQPGSDDAVVLDLKPLKDLLDMTRLFVNLLLGGFLLFTAIEFWRGILTG